ncbi:MAG: hypothetical protein A2849_01485 [Candidatus Taylorbacteria bacterium RIFCSPHIGHO2_01_FULL_51_15]|uniref:Uncharacterized protein n=1 Tax=Candidatus Taylorbacteria bacterium RIFCSPHIGHO2_01_FULL_51_15 TaxID=1802304 RepID=A0A1G2MD92_9BACT|nr:MAG: hypothetical protein A2849_01485 [Candidatus Taylorbacteria bacterium RIFCSPHIGHO2_01_FULL_51_15]
MRESSENAAASSSEGSLDAAFTDKMKALEEVLRAQGVKTVIEKNKGAVQVGSEQFIYGFVGDVDLSNIDPDQLPQMCYVQGSLLLSKRFIEKLRENSSFRSFEFNCPIKIVGASGLSQTHRDELLHKFWEANGVSASGREDITFVE